MNDSDMEQLLETAARAAEKAYVPYSGFPVGAALLGRSGRIYQGCNIENASYGASNCAERTALFKAVSEGETAFEAIAVTSPGLNEPCPPCGICRQVLLEFAPDLNVILGVPGQVEQIPLSQLLPSGFNASKLDRERSS